MSSTSSDSSVSEPYDKSKGEEFKFMTLNDKYVLIDKIGAGTFSAVWLAICIKNMELYAIKIQHLSNYDDGEKEAKFLTKIIIYSCFFQKFLIFFFLLLLLLSLLFSFLS